MAPGVLVLDQDVVLESPRNWSRATSPVPAGTWIRDNPGREDAALGYEFNFYKHQLALTIVIHIVFHPSRAKVSDPTLEIGALFLAPFKGTHPPRSHRHDNVIVFMAMEARVRPRCHSVAGHAGPPILYLAVCHLKHKDHLPSR